MLLGVIITGLFVAVSMTACVWHAPPPAVIETATNKPVIITPSNIAPTAANAATCPPIENIIKYKTTGDRTGNKDGIIISLIAATVNKSTNFA
jgi:hypothetical protein